MRERLSERNEWYILIFYLILLKENYKNLNLPEVDDEEGPILNLKNLKREKNIYTTRQK